MLNWTPNNHHAGIYIALEKGWYREAGLDVKIIDADPNGVEPIVAQGGADIGIAQAESIIPARAQGIPIVSIAALLPHNDSALMALAGSGITRPKDLEGKTYGGFGGALEKELISRLVTCDGGDPTKVKFVEVGNVDYLAGMDAKTFDFVWIFAGWDALNAQSVLQRPVSLIRFSDHLDCIPDWYTPALITSEKMLRDRPDDVRAFLAATARLRRCREEPGRRRRRHDEGRARPRREAGHGERELLRTVVRGRRPAVGRRINGRVDGVRAIRGARQV